MTDMDQKTLLLSAQRALLGQVPPNLRAVTLGWDARAVTVRYIFDGPVSASDDDEIRAAGSEIAADLPEGWTIDDEITRCDYPASLQPLRLRSWVYMRKEGRSAEPG